MRRFSPAALKTGSDRLRETAKCALRWCALVIGLIALAPAHAWAEHRSAPFVLELFTSQGCSSCPPADRLLKNYVDRSDIIALTMPVHYWDYLGWKDTFAIPRHARRQRAYARERGDGAVYTPQVVVNGRSHAVGSSSAQIDSAMSAIPASGRANIVPVSVSMSNGAVVIATGDAPDGLKIKDATIWFGMVQKTGMVSVRHGENSGRELTYYNIVRELSAVGMWDGTASKISIAKDIVLGSGADGCVVLIQAGTGGPIVGVAMWQHGSKKSTAGR